MLLALTGQGLLQALDQPLGVGRHAQEVCGLFERFVVARDSTRPNRAIEQDREAGVMFGCRYPFPRSGIARSRPIRSA